MTSLDELLAAEFKEAFDEFDKVSDVTEIDLRTPQYIGFSRITFWKLELVIVVLFIC